MMVSEKNKKDRTREWVYIDVQVSSKILQIALGTGNIFTCFCVWQIFIQNSCIFSCTETIPVKRNFKSKVQLTAGPY